MYKMSDYEFNGLERDKRGNVQDLKYWYPFITEKQKKLLSDADKQLLKSIVEIPGFMGRELALGY